VRNLRNNIFIISVLLILAGCAGRNNKAVEVNNSESRDFPRVSIPTVYANSDEKDRIEYLVDHYWDDFLDTSSIWKCDTALVNGVPKRSLEEVFGTYVGILDSFCGYKESQQSLSQLFAKAEAFEKKDTSTNVFETLSDFVSKYYYDPNSPVRNEEIYLSYVSKLAESQYVNPDRKLGYEYETQLCSMNRIGEKAADFKYKTSNDKVGSLYGVKADYTLLIFSDPDCGDCSKTMEQISSVDKISEMISSGKLAIVDIYIDLDVERWKEESSKYPSNWINGYDYNYLIRGDQIYNVRAIPSLYLLDNEKRVLLKDAPIEKIMGYLFNL